ncbi:MAG: hypothetical protein AAF810_26385, partial [Cyanobacteria bacterium P01_D01_bin.36]
MKLANPFYYPLSMLAGGVFLVAGARLVRLPSVVAIPGAGAIALTTATLLKSRDPQTIELENPALSRELQSVRLQAQKLSETAQLLESEATKLLTDVAYIDLLGTVQYVCDRIQDIPNKIDLLARKMQSKGALLSVDDTKKQLTNVNTKLKNSSGVAKEQWQTLAQQLEQNIALVQQGDDAREAQVAQLSTLIARSGGVLQELQNKLRTADLSSEMETETLKELSNELKGFQENVEVLL